MSGMEFGLIFLGVVVIFVGFAVTWQVAYYFGREKGLEEGIEVGKQMESLQESHRRIHDEAIWYVHMN
jgi:uncharacterized membrane protein YdjX (TVP38/TMEM64 family)